MIRKCHHNYCQAMLKEQEEEQKLQDQIAEAKRRSEIEAK